MSGHGQMPAFGLSEDEEEVLRHLQFECRETSLSALVRILLRESPKVRAKAKELGMEESVFMHRQRGGRRSAKEEG